MSENDRRTAVAGRVQELLESGFLRLPAGVRAEPGDPLAVHAPDGSVHSWMAPFTWHGKLVAWAQISESLEFLRFSLMAGGRMEACPDAADWLDPAHVAARIAAAAGEGGIVSGPMLTYDRDPSRIVWAVDVREASGTVKRWYAAGSAVWADSGDAEVTG